ELADREQDVLARRDTELEGVPGGESKLVEAVQVRRIGDRDLELAVLVRVRDRADALEHVQRQLPRRVRVHTDEGEVDERQLVPRGEHLRDAFARGNALLDEG